MSRSAALGPLVDLLAELYLTEESSRRVVAEAGLPLGRIPFQDAAVDNWFAILSEADRTDTVSALVEVAKEEYPEQAEPLNAALAAYQAAPEDPVPDDPSPEDPASEDPALSRAYQRNALLLTAAILVLSLWFYLHLYPVVQQSLANGALGAGLIAGLLAAWKLVTALLGKDLGPQSRSRIDRLLQNPRLAKVLFGLCAASLALALCTSSIYLQHGDSGEAELEVSITEGPSATPGGTAFEPRPRLSTGPDSEVDGGPVFFQPPGKALILEVTSPPTRSITPVQRRLWPWKRLEIRTAPKTLRAFRIALDHHAMSLLADPELATPFTTYALEIFWGDERFGRIDDLRQGLVYFGDDPAAIDALRQSETSREKADRLQECGDPDELMDFWNAGDQVVVTSATDEGTLKIRLLEMPRATDESSDPEPMVRSEAVVSAEDFTQLGIQTICLQGVDP